MVSVFAQVRYKIQCCGREMENLNHVIYHPTTTTMTTTTTTTTTTTGNNRK
jgi:hypothetical protein